MDPVTLLLLLGAVGLVGTSVQTDAPPTPEAVKNIEDQVLARLKDASLITVPPEETWVQVQNGPETWLVAPKYIAPVGIGEASRIATAHGYELPSPALVDAIWRAADLKLQPHPRGANDKPPSDFTDKTMNSMATHIAQLAWIQRQIDATNPNYKLLAGTHKDVVNLIIPPGFSGSGNHHLGIYGWQDQTTGKPIQTLMWGHASGNTPGTDWKDYSQGLRLVKRLS